MTVFFEEGWPPWDIFQARIKAAITRASEEHDTVGDLLSDLQLCEMFLREPGFSLEELDDVGSPAAAELLTALKTNASEDLFRYDQVYAANVVLASINAIANAVVEDEL